MDIDTKNKESEGAVSYTMDHPFYLICNPWCKGMCLQNYSNILIFRFPVRETSHSITAYQIFISLLYNK